MWHSQQACRGYANQGRWLLITCQFSLHAGHWKHIGHRFFWCQDVAVENEFSSFSISGVHSLFTSTSGPSNSSASSSHQSSVNSTLQSSLSGSGGSKTNTSSSSSFLNSMILSLTLPGTSASQLSSRFMSPKSNSQLDAICWKQTSVHQ